MEAGETREYHIASPSALFFHWFPFSFFVLCFWPFYPQGLLPSQLCPCASWEGLLFSSHAFFSALCVHPLKHAPLIFGEEDQAWWFFFIQCGHLQPSSPPGGLLHFCTLHHRLGDQPWGSSEWKWWVNMPPVWLALVKDAVALVPVTAPLLISACLTFPRRWCPLLFLLGEIFLWVSQ